MEASVPKVASIQKGPLSYAVDCDPLPPIEGPRLSLFRNSKSKVEFLKLLSDSAHSEQDSGGHAHVFQVRIGGSIYALKVFKFFHVPEGRREHYPYDNHEANDRTFLFQTDPFFAECRAYGRIAEIMAERPPRGRKGPIAVRCHGFVGLPAVPYEDEMHKLDGQLEWNRSQSDLAQPATRRMPFRAIVKDFVDDVAIRKPAKALKDLKELRENGIFPQDIAVRNYKSGMLIDFSSAWTMPHWIMEALEEAAVRERQARELEHFDAMMKEERIRGAPLAVQPAGRLSTLRTPRAPRR